MAPEVKLNSVRMQRAYRCNNIEAARLQDFLKVLEKHNKYEKRAKEDEVRLVEYTMERIRECSGLSPESAQVREVEEKREAERARRAKSAPAHGMRGRLQMEWSSAGNSRQPRPFSTKTAYNGRQKVLNSDGVGKPFDSIEEEHLNLKGKKSPFSGSGAQFGVKKGWADVGTFSPDSSDVDDDGTVDDSDDSDETFHPIGKPKMADGKDHSLLLPSDLISHSQKTTSALIENRKQAQQNHRSRTGSQRRLSSVMTPSQALLTKQVTSVRRLEKCREMIAAERNFQQDVLRLRLEGFKKLYPLTENSHAQQ